MSHPYQMKPPAVGRIESTSLDLPLRRRRGSLEGCETKRKQDLYDSDDDDPSSTDSEQVTDLEDAIDSDWDSDSSCSGETMAPQPQVSEHLETLARQFASRSLPALLRWMDSAHYIPPPTHRIAPRKRRARRSSNGSAATSSRRLSRSLLMETQDPDDPSTVLIQRVDGYFPLSCPFSVADPTRHRFCALQQHTTPLRSVYDLLRHLKNHHPNPLYCPKCGQMFASLPARDKHIRVWSCRDTIVDLPPQGVSRAQLQAIVEHDDRNQREEVRWRRIYAALFPGTARPRRGAAYLGRGLPLAVAMTRDYWEQHGRRLVKGYLAGSEGSLLLRGVGAQVTSEEVLLALCELVREELVQMVKDHSGSA